MLIELDGSLDLGQGEVGADIERRITAGRAELEISGRLSAICGLDVSVIERLRLPSDMAHRIAEDLIEVF